MAINFRKLKSQIRSEKHGKRTQYIFDATPAQLADDVIPIAAWSRKQLIDILAFFANVDAAFSKHFKF